MKLRLKKMRRRLFGGYVCLLEALENGAVSRSDVASFDLLGGPALFHERAEVKAGDRLRWPVRHRLTASPGDTVSSSDLPRRPGPSGLKWETSHIL